MTRFLKKKIINFIVKKGNKFLSENILKKSFKHLNKNTKKQIKMLIYIAINNSLPTFQIEINKKRIKKIKLIKFKPFFVLKNKNRISSSIKIIVNFSKIRNNTSFLTNLKNEFILSSKNKSGSVEEKNKIQKQALAYQNILTFYRW